jgi:YHS domain-containing protein
MKHFLALCALTTCAAALPADPPGKRTPREALQPFGDLVGTWKGTGVPKGKPGKTGFWVEQLAWQWQFKKDDAWLKVTVEKGKSFTEGELHYRADKDQYEFIAQTPDKQKQTWRGTLADKKLTLEREDEATQQKQRMVLTLLHSNRFLYSMSVKPADKATYVGLYQVGATKEGMPFAGGDGKPECIVSGGAATIPVRYMGQTYYVCCSGCRDEFNDNPKKYVDEYNAKKKKQ